MVYSDPIEALRRQQSVVRARHRRVSHRGAISEPSCKKIVAMLEIPAQAHEHHSEKEEGRALMEACAKGGAAVARTAFESSEL